MNCRLCGEALEPRFEAQVLAKYAVRYLACRGCGSLQTEPPFWMAEAYASNLGDLDCGAVQRNLSAATATMAVARLWGLRDAVDFGGGDGLLCRFLRDYGLNCFVEDKYAEPIYGLGFTTPDFERPELLLAFEVLEHFLEPKDDIAALFARQPKVLFGSTQAYAGQGADWHYLARDIGHHVFFYSDRALALIGDRFGYRAERLGPYFIFVSRDCDSAWRMAALRLVMQRWVLRLLRGVLVVSPHPGPARDIALLKRRAAA